MTANPFQKAAKTQLKARLALAGPTGSGKTWSALTWASVLGQKVALIDTERGSAALYADHFEFDTLDMAPPYEPQRCVDALRAAEANGYDVVILDSMSHFWQGEGGTLDIVDSAAQRMGGNKYAGWSVGTPALRHLVDTMLALDAHLIVTMRSKMDYVEVEKNGRKTYERVGMAPVMRDGIEYEFTLLGDVDLEHRIVISKSRCDLLADAVVQPGRAADAAQTFKGWLETGEPVAARSDIDALTARMNALPEVIRKTCKTAFFETFGRPDHLVASRLDEAQTFVNTYEQQTDPPPDGDGTSSAPDEPGADDASVSSARNASEPGVLIGSDGVGAELPVASAPDDQVYRDVDLLRLAGEVFAQARLDAQRGQKSKIVDRLRHALTWAVTEGRATSTKELTPAEKHKLWMELSWLRDGFAQWEHDDDQLVISREDRRVVILFADVEAEGAAA